MPDKKLEKAARKGARKTGRLIEELNERLDKYRIDDAAWGMISEIVVKLEELRDHEQGIADHLKLERKGSDDEADDED